MIDYTYNPIIPADYKIRRERTSLRNLSLQALFLWCGGDGGRIPPSRTAGAAVPGFAPWLRFSGCLFQFTPGYEPTDFGRGFSSLFSTHYKKRALQALFLWYGGDGGSRTHVQKYFRRTFSERSQCFVIRRIRRDADTLRNCYPVSPLKYQELFQRFPAFITPDFKPAGEPEAARGAELCSQCEIVVIFSVYI